MNHFAHAYNVQSLFSGWTRIDMLLALYDRAISAAVGAQQAHAAGDQAMFAHHFLDTQRSLLAIHGGLKPEESELAYNLARLLHFISNRLYERNFQEVIHFLEKLRSGFEQIREEATELERSGKIPSFQLSGGLNEVV